MPRGSLDLYTPRFVKGRGTEKVGMCPICVEPAERGGENKKLWFAMKFSAFKWYVLCSCLVAVLIRWYSSAVIYFSFSLVVANHLQLPHAIRAWSLSLSSTDIENANSFDDAVGISASTGRPFSPPTSFRLIERPKPGKNEKTHIQQGKCHKCDKWVAVEGIKDLESKVISAIFSLFVRPVDH